MSKWGRLGSGNHVQGLAKKNPSPSFSAHCSAKHHLAILLDRMVKEHE